MSGDPCICGDTETWHPECYQKQQEEATRQALTAAESRGREAAFTLAAEIAEAWITSVSVYLTVAEAKAATAVKMEIAGAIRSCMGPFPSAMEIEGCRWKQGTEHMKTSCGETVSGHYGQTHCPYCSRPIITA